MSEPTLTDKLLEHAVLLIAFLAVLGSFVALAIIGVGPETQLGRLQDLLAVLGGALAGVAIPKIAR